MIHNVPEGTGGIGYARWTFPKFDDSGAHIWIDKFHIVFNMYQIPHGFKVSVATMYLVDSAAHGYQAYKMANAWYSWDQF